MAFVHNAAGLFTARFFLGMFEAGLFPGLNFLISCWYTREQQNQRVAWFFSGATLSGAFGGLLAFGIRHMAGVGGKDGWAWIFILEGLLTILCAIPAYWVLVDFPQESKLLNEEERGKWINLLTRSQGITNYPLPFSKRQVIKSFLSWKVWIYSLIYFGIGVPFYSTAFFIPTIIKGLGFTNANANLLSVPPFAFGTLITLITGYFSDKYQVRGPFVVALSSVTAVGMLILVCNVSVGAKYFACFLAVTGASSAAPSAITWISSNTGPVYARATAMGIFFTLGNLAGVPASNVYPANEGPRYVKGNSHALAFTLFAMILAGFLSWYLRRENARRDALYGVPPADGSHCSPHNANDPVLKKKYGLEHLTEQEIIELGDDHPAFRYFW